MLKIGSHIPFKSPNYLVDSVKETINNGANVMMIYLGAPQNSKRVSIEKYNLEQYQKKFNQIIKPEDIIVHAPYIINLANKEKENFAKQFLIEEIKRMNYIGAKYIVLHPGASLKQNVDEAIINLSNNIKDVLKETKDVEIIIETMSGKGTEIGTSLEQLAKIIDLINDQRIGICLDTCHMWDAGYDLKNDFENNNGEILFNKLNQLNLLKRIKVIHLNDSKNNIGSHKDRHENIGKGFIGLKALKKFANHPNFDNIPIILETPWVEDKMIYKEEIQMIKND
ncbi:MAG: deoxyribonuclease IV [Mycoplasmataceae bacterium]|nr:deoxyribonuclease IV [Mycoplasmataceae bacterium]MBR4025567.1 deoxyribonuclease IV [Mycoplasmataceae bacterium]